MQRQQTVEVLDCPCCWGGEVAVLIFQEEELQIMLMRGNRKRR
jgi:hypothetical protein